MSTNTFLGKILRLPLKLIPKSFIFPVLQGRARGKLWVVGSGNHSFWLGNFEYSKRKLLEKTITPNAIVYDIGANVGYYTLLASELVKPNGIVFSFEPLPRNIAYLAKHLKLNKINNVKIIKKAVTDSVSKAKFTTNENPCTGHVSNKGDLIVNTINIDFLIEQKKILPPDFIKIDIEGGEFLALQGALTTIKQYKPIIALATHSNELHISCCNLLKSLDYDLFPINNRDNVHSTDEIIAFPK